MVIHTADLRQQQVVMISLDGAIATQPDSDSRQRHLAYAERVGHLTIIAYTRAGTGGALALSPRLTVIPTNSRHPLTYFFDALRLAYQVAAADLIIAQDPFLTGLIGWLLRQNWHVPLLVQNHSYYFGNQAWIDEHPLRNRILAALGRFVVKQADMYRTVNRKERDNYIANGGDPQRVVALPLGTASMRFAEPISADVLEALRTRIGLAPADKVVLWVGYPVGFKRVPLLFKVFRRVLALEPQARLLLVGDMKKSPYDLPALMQAEGIAERTIFYGPVLHDELPAYYTLGQVYVHTSSYEGVPRVLFEASAAGLPLVGMDVVGVVEVIETDVNGYLVADGDIDGMAQRIVSLLNDPQQAQTFGLAARQLALERYDAERYLDQWVAVWMQAIQLGMRP